MTVGRPVQLFALVALFAAFAGAGTLMLHKKPTTASPIKVSAPHRAAAAAPTSHPAARPPAKPAVHKQPPALIAADGLPMSLAKALRTHRVVVVSLFDPQSQTDAIAFAEARAGARAARVGFLGVSVLDNAVAGPLTAALPAGQLLPEPGLLIYRRPNKLVQRIDGFADRDAVAQAAVASASGPPLVGAGS
jgi:hypothetical protein